MVLPAPLPPRRPWISRAASAKLTSFRATFVPKDLCKPFISRMVSADMLTYGTLSVFFTTWILPLLTSLTIFSMSGCSSSATFISGNWTVDTGGETERVISALFTLLDALDDFFHRAFEIIQQGGDVVLGGEVGLVDVLGGYQDACRPWPWRPRRRQRCPGSASK